MTDFYEVLGVGREANDDEIKKAYRRLARQYHPDTNDGDPAAEARFKEISVAYETLRDPEKRRRYDQYGAEGLGAPVAGPEGSTSASPTCSTPSSGAASAAAGGRAVRPGAPTRRSRLILDLEEAVFGVAKPVELRMPVECERCTGSGCEPGTHPSTCRTCGGAGEVRTVRRTILGQMMTASPCTACRGTGREILSPCRDCRGDGRVTLPATVEVQVPAGIDGGQRLRLSGRGPAAPRGGEPGDLYVSIAVRRHPRFERDGDDLLHVLRLPMTQASLGAHLRIETLDGEEDLLIPAGTQTGRQFKLRGRGVPALRSRHRGDLIVSVEVVVPEKLTAEEASLIRRLAELRGEDVAPRDEGFFSKIKSAFQ